jgi:hypothetical protein
MRRFVVPAVTSVAYGTLVALSVWIGLTTDWEENAHPLWALYLLPHVALGVICMVWWRWAALLIVIPVGIAAAYTDFGCEGVDCTGEPAFVYVLVGVGLLVLIGLGVGAIVSAALDRGRR